MKGKFMLGVGSSHDNFIENRDTLSLWKMFNFDLPRNYYPVDRGGAPSREILPPIRCSVAILDLNEQKIKNHRLKREIKVSRINLSKGHAISSKLFPANFVGCVVFVELSFIFRPIANQMLQSIVKRKKIGFFF